MKAVDTCPVSVALFFFCYTFNFLSPPCLLHPTGICCLAADVFFTDRIGTQFLQRC